MKDSDYIEEAVKIGNKIAAPYNFGAVVVKDGNILASEHGHVFEKNNPFQHAEVSAITKACGTSGSNYLEGATLYCSHEPCVMCFCCAAWAHIDRIVYAIPANQQDRSMYEFENVSLSGLTGKLLRPIIVEHLSIKP